MSRDRDTIAELAAGLRNGKRSGTTSAASDVGQRQAVPGYVEFPADCLPERAQPFARQVAAATNTDPAFVSLYLLSLLSAMVDTTRAIIPKCGWKVFPVVWACAIGRSASGKSPPLAAIADALTPLVAELDEEDRAEKARWEERKANHLSDPQKRGMSAPLARRLKVGDATIEALAGVLVGNPRGVWMVAEELAGCLATIPDARGRHGLCHPLSALLGMVVLAILMGRTSLAGMARFGCQFGPKLAFALGFRRGRTPSTSTLSRTRAALDPVAVEDALARWVTARLDPTDLGHISLAGKTVCGSRAGEVPAVHLLPVGGVPPEVVGRELRHRPHDDPEREDRRADREGIPGVPDLRRTLSTP